MESLEDRTLLAYDFGYALGLGSAGIDSANQVATDAAGNVLVAGAFASASLDLDPGPSTYLLTSADGYDGFVAKYDSAGNLAWGVQIGGTGVGSAYDVEVDGPGNVLIAGLFAGTVEIGAPGQPPVTLTNGGSNEGFLAKLDPAGNVLWATTFGTTADPRLAHGIAVDAVGNVYATGDQGKKLFVAKYSADGAPVWTQVISEGTGIVNAGGTASYAHGTDVAVDGAGNVHVTGNYLGTIDFNSNPTKTNSQTSVGWKQNSFSSSPDAFVLKLNASGAYVWAGSMGSGGYDGGLGIALDAARNVHVNGVARADADFDPGRGKLNLPGTGVIGFVVKLDPKGNLLWGRSGVGRYGIAVDGDGAVYTTEGFAGTIDADPGPGTFPLTATGNRDLLVSKLNSAGNFVWAGAMGGAGAYLDNPSIAVNGQGNIFTAGVFRGTADFDPGAGTYPLTSTLDGSGNPTSDAFVSKLVPMAALQAAGGTAPKTAGGANLNAEQVTSLLAEALARWHAAGVDTSVFASFDIRIGDLGGTTLGLASGNTIWLDDNGAGWGWFVDSTPWDNSEFTMPGDQGEQNRMDLLTVVMHELGHLLGHDHDAEGVMAETLAAGTRRGAGGGIDAGEIQAAQDAYFAWLNSEEEMPLIGHRHGRLR